MIYEIITGLFVGFWVGLFTIKVLDWYTNKLIEKDLNKEDK